MKVLSLFDGISCGYLALKRAGISVSAYDAYEIDPFAVEVAKRNHPDIVHHGDVMGADFSEFKDYDLLIGGSPCTYWSICKKGREVTSDGVGFALFKRFCEAKEVLGDVYFLYENNHSIHRDIKEEITKSLGVEPIMINSERFSAQSRRRMYWTNIPIQELPERSSTTFQDVIDRHSGGYSWREKSLAVKANDGNNYATSSAHKVRRDYFGMLNVIYIYISKEVCTMCKDLYKRGQTNVLDDPYRELCRVPTISEYEELQTLPVGYIPRGISGSYSKEYRNAVKAIGNGWTVDVIAHIFKGLKETPSVEPWIYLL